MSIRDFIQRHYRHFNAGALADCAESLNEFIGSGGRLMVTLAGAMSTAEIGRSLAPAIRAQKVHAICCTGANLEEDLFHLVAASHYEKISDWRNLSASDDAKLKERGLNRVTDVAIPEEAKLRYGHTNLSAVDLMETVSISPVGSSANIEIRRRDICQLMRERAVELIRLVDLKLQQGGLKENPNSLVYITGGASQLPGFLELG